MVSTDSMALLVDASLRAAAVLAAGWTLTAFMRRASAATRHFAWVCTIVAAVLVPATAIVAPDWTVRPPRSLSTFASSAGDDLRVVEPRGDATTGRTRVPPSDDREITVPTPAASSVRRFDSVTVLLSVWAAGTAAVLLYMLLGATAVWHLRRSARPATAAWLDTARVLAEGFDVPPSVVFMESSIGMPIVCGVWRPAIVMPRGARE